MNILFAIGQGIGLLAPVDRAELFQHGGLDPFGLRSALALDLIVPVGFRNGQMIIPAVRRRLDMVRNDGLRGIDYIEHAVVCPRLDLDGDDVSDLIAHFGCCGHDIYGRIFQVLHFDERFLVESQGRAVGKDIFGRGNQHALFHADVCGRVGILGRCRKGNAAGGRRARRDLDGRHFGTRRVVVLAARRTEKQSGDEQVSQIA